MFMICECLEIILEIFGDLGDHFRIRFWRGFNDNMTQDAFEDFRLKNMLSKTFIFGGKKTRCL